MSELHDVLIRPILTEKTTQLEEADNVYSFEVGVGANKHQIKTAGEAVVGVSFGDVRTSEVSGEGELIGRQDGERATCEKSSVQVAVGDSIN